MQLDPSKTYADIRAKSDRVVALVTGVSYVPDRFMQRRRYIEVPQGVTVNVGDVYHADGFSAPAPDLPADNSDFAKLPKWVRALGLLIAQYAGKTPQQVKQDYLNIYNSL